MKFEQETLEKVMKARSQVAAASVSQNMGALGAANSDLDVKEDLNKDGRIDLREWEHAVLEAKREVARQHGEIRLRDGVHLLRKPKDGRLFLLSNLPEERLARKYVLWGGSTCWCFWVPLVARRICWVPEQAFCKNRSFAWCTEIR